MKIFLLVVVLLVGGLLSLPFLLIDDTPRVRGNISYSAADIDRVKLLIKRNDPRQLDAGEVVTQWVDEAELELLMGYALAQLKGGAGAIELHPGRAYIEVAVRLPENPIGRWLNGRVTLGQVSDALVLEDVKVGSIAVPGWIADPLLRRVNDGLRQAPEYDAVLHAVNGFRLLENRMVMIYQWQPELARDIVARGRNMVVDDGDRERLLLYNRQVQSIAGNPAFGRTVSLAEFMPPLFMLAQARAGDPVAENRAALLALSFYLSGVDIPRMLGVELPKGDAPRRRLELSGRDDFAQHFLSSAALTLTGGRGLADTIGLFKELDDAGGGSGFSFTDLGADRAGVRFAELAVASESSARKLQAFVVAGIEENDIIPDFLDLPEYMADDVFRERYGGVGDRRYEVVARDIETRLSGVRLYRTLGQGD